MWVRLMLMAAVGVSLEGKKMPGMVVRITPKGLQYVSEKGSQLLQKELMKIQLPKHLGTKYHEFISMMITKIHLRNSHLGVIHEGLKLSITHGSVSIIGKWSDHKPIKNHIPFDLKINDISITVIFQLGKNNKHQITIFVSSCNSNIKSVDMTTSTNLSSLKNLYKNLGPQLQKNVCEKICEVIKNSTTSYMEPYLQTMPVKVNADKIAGINYSLMKPPKSNYQSLDLSLKGKFFGLTHHRPYPFHPSFINFNDDKPHMIYFGVSYSFFDSAKHVYQLAGIRSLEMNNSMVPEGSNYHLTTSFYGTLIPQLSKEFPKMGMKIFIDFPSVPTIDVSSRNEMGLMFSLSTRVYVIFSNSSMTLLFKLSLKTAVALYIKEKSGNISGHITLKSLHVELKHSRIGNFEVSVLQAPFSYYMSKVWIPKINGRLENGYPLPIPTNLHLSDFVVHSYKNFLVFGTDFHYS